VAQRLARRLCKECKEPVHVPKDILIPHGFTPEEAETCNLYGPKGCPKCTGGYRGRFAILEPLTVNEEVKRLILDGGLNSSFVFSGPAATNALYVDYLEFRNSMTAFDNSGNLANLQFAPGMKIYYAQLIINGISFAEKLNHKNGGGLNWVAAYAGAFSSTNLVYPDGTTNRLNTIAYLEFLRDVELPATLARYRRQLEVYRTVGAASQGQAAALRNTVFNVANDQKRSIVYLQSLRDPRVMAHKREWERSLRARVNANPKMASPPTR
jgi:hypothetical protein